MKVFGCIMRGGYRGGIVLVAANDVRQAFELASCNPKCCIWFDWRTPDGNWATPFQPGAKVRSDYYSLECWQEFEHLSCDYTKPQVILEESYAE